MSGEGGADRQPRRYNWLVGLSATLMVAIGLILMFLLAQATNNRLLYERYYSGLFLINGLVAALLILVIVWVSIRLLVRWRRGYFGSRLLVKLAAIFALVGFAPGLLIYVVSYQFVSRSIESWFDVKVEGALDAGLNLGRVTLDTLASDLGTKTRSASAQLSNMQDARAGLMLERVQDQLSASEVMLWSGTGQLIAGTGASRYKINPERLPTATLRSIRSQRLIISVEGLDDATSVMTSAPRIRALALVNPNGFDLQAEPRVLEVVQPLPPSLVANAIAVQSANREYQERALAREGLRRMYIGTLTLSLFLAVFGAVLLAVVLGNQLARPLLLLAEGVRQVAAGDLGPKSALQGRDELGGLTRDFAKMTHQLADARQALEKSIQQVNTERASLQTVLDNLTAGVMVLDAQGLIQSANPGATRILRAPLAAHEGRALSQVPGLEMFARQVQAQFDAFDSEQQQHSLDHWQQAFDLQASPAGFPLNTINVVARGAALPGSFRLLVMDDISEIVSAQRAQAWGEVARRLAHEIKNPLTPIQLSAERLEMKLASRLAGPDLAILIKSVRTIVDQVDAMKRLVNEFRDYARLPSADLQPINLNELITDVLHLYSPDNAMVPVQSELDERCPAILGDAQQLRQVIHNLLQNAQDASEAAAHARDVPPVIIRTRWMDTAHQVRLSVLDRGTGFAPHILKRAFEPYVTTKAKGTGLGLAVVRKIADEHGARVDIANRNIDGEVRGAQVSLSFPVGSAASA